MMLLEINWIIVLEGIQKGIVFICAMVVLWFLWLIGEEQKDYKDEETQTIEDFNQQFAAVDGDFERYADGMGKGWSKAKKEKYIMLSKKLETGISLESEEMDWYRSIIKKPKNEKENEKTTDTLKPGEQEMIENAGRVFDFKIKKR